ncbi:XdhC/CoxI family protein [Streptomyces sp. SID3343]|uniref:XdhC family protein n=1 Tax=Streptomyces sp. SID3343 TaxID=2690260 RepID=UPI00136CB2F4|nr:XdhC/CoxI family protein [Streptomyces sp. SID3343]MYW00477.1 xanthine dehydrogenase [Streptomyces sp. SID3343]
MLDLGTEIAEWRRAGTPYALATVVGVSGSAPRPPGAALAVGADGTVVGSVSGGCVEGAVYELCRAALESGTPVLQRFGYSDEDAFAVGLTCGGVIDVFVQPGGDAAVEAALAAAERDTPVAAARVVAGPAALVGRTVTVTADTTTGTYGADPALDASVIGEARAMLDVGRTGLLTLRQDGRPCPEVAPGDVTIFVESRTPPPRLLVYGAIDFAAAVARMGKLLGYRVTVCDARPVFATRRRFPDADEVVVDWPHRHLDLVADRLDGRTVVAVLTHDAKFDVPLLELALKLRLGYVGAMGSRRTHEQRVARLREIGVTERELAALRSPIGLDLGARTPEETALSVFAEVVAARHGGTGLPLRSAGGPIHHAA